MKRFRLASAQQQPSISKDSQMRTYLVTTCVVPKSAPNFFKLMSVGGSLTRVGCRFPLKLEAYAAGMFPAS